MQVELAGLFSVTYHKISWYRSLSLDGSVGLFRWALKFEGFLHSFIIFSSVMQRFYVKSLSAKQQLEASAWQLAGFLSSEKTLLLESRWHIHHVPFWSVCVCMRTHVHVSVSTCTCKCAYRGDNINPAVNPNFCQIAHMLVYIRIQTLLSLLLELFSRRLWNQNDNLDIIQCGCHLHIEYEWSRLRHLKCDVKQIRRFD